VANQPCEINVAKWNVVFIAFGFPRLELKPGDDHSSHSEENNIRRRHENAGRIKLRAGLIIHRFISSEPWRKPCVERVWVLRPSLAGRPDLDENIFLFCRGSHAG